MANISSFHLQLRMCSFVTGCIYADCVVFQLWFMALKHDRTAYVCCVPIGTSESVLKAVLNNGNQSEYSVVVNELNQGVAVVKIFGNGLYNIMSVSSYIP